jgi:hypothetical protein
LISSKEKDVFDSSVSDPTVPSTPIGGLDPLYLLQKLLPAEDCSGGIPAIFMAGYLCEMSVIKVDPQKFDEAGQQYCKAVSLSTELWEQTLSSLIRSSFKSGEDEKHYQNYMVRAVAEYMKFAKPTEAKAPELVDLAPMTIEIPVPRDYAAAHQLLSSGKDREVNVKDSGDIYILRSWVVDDVPEARQLAERDVSRQVAK